MSQPFNLSYFLINFVFLKLTGYILSFYLIILAAIPCCAFDNCPDDKTSTSSEKHPGKHEAGGEDCGNCSPFFSCEGCATATIAVESPVLEILPVNILSVYCSYIEKELPSIKYDYWLPPKIS